jgi:signal transduction histidine kinase
MVDEQGTTNQPLIKPAAAVPAHQRIFSKKNLMSIGAVVLLTIFVSIVRAVDEVLTHDYGIHTALVFPFLSALLLFAAGKYLLGRSKRSDEQRYEFITVAAHRLRTPLSRLNWMVSGLQGEVSSESGKSLVDDAGKTVAELTGIANQLLNAAEAGESSLYYTYIFHPENLGLIVRQSIGEYAIGAMKKNIEVLISAPTDLPAVNVDRDRIREAIGAFLENAILYTPEQGRIEVFVVREWNHLKVSIKDNGIGISKSELPYVFTKFFRTKDAVTKDADRAGLGLAIAKDIIIRHGGDVGVESGGKDQGSLFWFTLPIMHAA